MVVVEQVAARPVRLRDFVRLKLRLIGNGMRGRPGRIVFFVLGICVGGGLAVGGFFAFLLSGAVHHDAGVVLATYVGSALVLGWLLLPVLFFGVDETLDPARFALFPLSRRTLATGMLAAACAGVPAVATMLALLGLAVAGAARAGVAGAVVGLVGALLGLLLCVVASRAVTSALAAMLRSRRVRDLTAVLLALVSASIGPLNLVLNTTVTHASLGPALRVARILGWTPFAAGFVAPYDIAAGRPLLAVVRLAMVAATVVLLLWWWSRTLESAMLGGSSEGPGGGAVRGGAVAALLPLVVRAIRPGVFTAIVARELRYWWRDPRRRSGLISILVGGAVLPIALTLAGDRHGHRSGVPLPLTIAFSCAMGAAILANQFGFDGTAYSVHLMTGVPGRTDLRARATALILIVAPVLLLVAVVVGVVAGAGGALVPALGTMSATFGASLAVASVLSVLTAYPVPESRNALAVNSGSGSAKGLLAFVGILSSLVGAAPVLVASVLLPGGVTWLVAPVGVAWGVGAVLLGTYIGGDLLARRGPELLVAVTPGR
ncbi:MAG TPA: ABC transporter permease [Rugosimonospora sp.]|nr:ABC transporter permease [Rugosimonospora sp.]